MFIEIRKNKKIDLSMRPVIVYREDNGNVSFVGLFKSAADAGRLLSIPKSLISKCLNEKYVSISAYGYKFGYFTDLDDLIVDVDRYLFHKNKSS